MPPTEARAKELLSEAKRLVSQLKAADALSSAREALSIFRELSDQAGVALALRPLLASQLELGELKPEEALKLVKEEAGKVKRSARDARRAEAMFQLAQAEVHLAKAEPIKAVQIATEAEVYFQREEDWPALADVLLEVVAPAQLLRGDGKKALAAANLVLDVAQKVKDPEVEARAWGLISAGRFLAKAEDAAEAALKAVDLFRNLGSKIREVAALIDLARGHLSAQAAKQALSAATDALTSARSAGSWAQVGQAVEAIVEARLQAREPQAALKDSEEQLQLLSQGLADSGRQKGIASAMAAVVVATSALKGVDDGLEAAKGYVEKLRADGNKRGEVRMLHKLANMSPFPDYALNTAQAALAMAQKAGFASEEKALKNTLTELYVASGKVDKAPNRRDALVLLQDLARELEKKDGDKFDDANKNLEGYWNALTQSDVDASIQKVVSRDPTAYLAFLKDHGANVAVPGESQKAASDDIQGLGLENMLKTGPKEYLYVSFRVSGISYGPRYRCVDASWGIGAEMGATAGALQLQDVSDDWERELQFNPSILDCALQHGAATQYWQTNP
eukprot:TRINITY_DN10719_c0_g2_i1.p1 TRINITY_DN10719_c0_g2~~TRINITY_DN10719_c0_g2_i1.p1  ORF type:complete len:566 (-),score=179.52 TRINITY_DN10719_c0_g2_i1:49-1746(-)